jgi:3'-5' exoribonuclease
MSLPVPLYAYVVEEQRKTTKNGMSYWQNQLKTVSGIIRANTWDIKKDAESSPLVPHKGDIISITVLHDSMAEHKSITIKEFNRITREDLPDDAKSVLEVEKADPKQLEYAASLIWDNSFWENPKHHEFTTRCLKKLGVEKLQACPAATHIHHRYAGGLLVHTAEVLQICRAIAEASPQYGFINRDVLYAGAILHDMGKVYTYCINEIGMASHYLNEKTVGHLFYSVHLVETTYSENKTLVERWFVDEVMHCVGSHHGDPVYGSLKKVQSIEAGIISKVDYISARNGMVDAMLRDAVRSKQTLPDHDFVVYGDSYFASHGMKKYMENID